MSAAKEKIFPGKIAARLAVTFIILAATGTPVAMAKTPCATQNGAGENSAAAVQLRLAQSPQTAELQREKSLGRYDLALDDTLAAESTPSLIHLTDESGLAGIITDSAIIGGNGMFAVPESVANESTAIRVLRTGLSPSKTENFVQIPNIATNLFSRPLPIGPYSAWKYFGGVQYAPAGSLNIATGAFTPVPSLLGPKMLIYGPDVLFYGGVATAGGTYYYTSQGGNR